MIEEPIVDITQSSFRREWIAWLLIAGATTLIVYSNAISAVGRDGGLADTATARFRALVLIGTTAMERRIGISQDKRLTAQLSTTITQLERESRSPEDKFRAAIVAGEVIGKERALMMLDTISTERDAELASDVAAARTVYADGPEALPSDTQQRLIRRHGDFGKIVLAFDVPPDKEPRKLLEQASWRVLLVASVVGFGFLLLAIVSLVLFVLAVILRVKNRIAPAYVVFPSPDSSFLEAFAFYLIALTGLGIVLRFLGLRSLGWNLLLLVVPITLLLWIGKRRGSVTSVLKMVGLHRGRGWWTEIGAGLLGYVGGLVIIVPSVLITLVLIRFTGSNATHPIIGPLLAGGRWHVAALYGLSCVLAPATEETMFRGILFHHLRSRWSWLTSAGVISLLFALLHPQGWAAVPALGGIALVLSGIREWRDSLIAPIAAHAFNNFIALTFALLLLR